MEVENMAQVTVYLREKDVEKLRKLVTEFEKKNLLPKSNRSTVTEKILMDYIEMMSEMDIKKGSGLFGGNLIFEYAKQVSEARTKDDELEKQKVALFNSFMDRFLARRKKIDRLEGELQALREFASTVKYESGESILEQYEKQRLNNN